MSHQLMNFDRFIAKYSLPLCLLGLVAWVLLESLPAIDQVAQRPFFDKAGWLLSEPAHKAIKAWAYTGPKVLLGITAGLSLLFSLGIYKIPPLRQKYAAWQKPLLLLALSLALVPLCISTLKAVSGVYSPVDLLPYGGKHEHIGVLAHLWQYGTVDGGRSFPAGHASGGFALMALYFLPLDPKKRLAGLGFGLLAGWSMGFYQMARGEHFLSHTMATMFAAWVIIMLLTKALGLQKQV